jgi:lipoate synthase
LRWLAERPGIQVSLLTQYLAPAHARGELATSLRPEEIEQAQTLAASLGLKLVT